MEGQVLVQQALEEAAQEYYRSRRWVGVFRTFGKIKASKDLAQYTLIKTRNRLISRQTSLSLINHLLWAVSLFQILSWNFVD
ncbi:hypothetical protein ACS0TY_013229 [Phlomoides rotata]